MNLAGDLNPGTHTLIITSPNGLNEFEVCSFTLDPNGRQGCSSNTNVGGFATARVEDSMGNIVARAATRAGVVIASRASP